MYNNNFSNFGTTSYARTQSQFGQQNIPSMQAAGTQYQGIQRQYQPVGYVQSYYDPSRTNQNYGQAASLYSQPAVTTSYQPSNYRPSQFSYGQIPSQHSFQNVQQTLGSQYGTGTAVQSTQSYGQTYVSPNAFHLPNYQGNQPGHDAWKRSDSSTPAQSSYPIQSGFGTQGMTFGQSGQQYGSSF